MSDEKNKGPEAPTPEAKALIASIYTKGWTDGFRAGFTAGVGLMTSDQPKQEQPDLSGWFNLNSKPDVN